MNINGNGVPRPPQGDHPNISPWLDEQIWGHRIYDQSPWLIFLEFLTVAEACAREGRLLDESGVFYPLMFKPYKRMMLRNILWNNEAIERIDADTPDSERAWEIWLERMKENSRGVVARDFGYLRARFRSFKEFASLVAMLRDAAVESNSNKRWTSRFVFPFGPNALYEDLGITAQGTPTREYINFGRTGELLYLMLSRSQFTDELRPHLNDLLKGDNQWNKLLGLFQNGPGDDLSLRGKSYLPLKSYDSFDDLGEDWLRIFELKLPGFDAIEHLVTLGAFHILLYQLRVAAQWSDAPKPLFFVCEMVAPSRTLVRKQSTLNFQENDVLTTAAVEAYINQIEKSERWQAAVASAATPDEAFTHCRQILEEEVWWGDDYGGTREPDKLLSELRDVAARRHRQNIAGIHRSYGRDVGLVSKRGTNKYRYAPNDALLKTLLLANVPKRLELHEFLQRLYDRYGLVFGERQASEVLSSEDYDQNQFADNAKRLEQRLGSLGLLRRLSDGCAYVVNPINHE